LVRAAWGDAGAYQRRNKCDAAKERRIELTSRHAERSGAFIQSAQQVQSKVALGATGSA
jgi:hypothetical protein